MMQCNNKVITSNESFQDFVNPGRNASINKPISFCPIKDTAA